jgi:hypothetical protein
MPQRLTQQHAQGQADFDCQIRIDRPPAPYPRCRRAPFKQQVLIKPDRQITPLSQAFILLGPIGDLVPRLPEFVTLPAPELVRHQILLPENLSPRYRKIADPCNKVPSNGSRQISHGSTRPRSGRAQGPRETGHCVPVEQHHLCVRSWWTNSRSARRRFSGVR